MKVGIITHYYKSTNYGGNLQAYALCKYLNKMGYEAEQICFQKTRNDSNTAFSLKKVVGKFLKVFRKIKNVNIRSDLNDRNNCIIDFNQNLIPHSRKVYTSSNISECVHQYDAFITGSDQVWHPIAYCSAYGLEFVPSSKIKMSFAASIAADSISEEYKNVLKNALASFKGISVREKEAIALLKDKVTQQIDVSLDPTLLLTSEEWDSICSERIINEPYVFCYFLGNEIQDRKLAQEYAKTNNLKLVSLPYLLGNYRKCDKDFGDYKLFKVSPIDFISLIKHADIIFTDSFHASAFSCIYHKQFFVFARWLRGSMNSRITTLMEIFHTEDRFCNTEDKKNLKYINELNKIDYSKTISEIEFLKEKSKKYIYQNLSEKNEN